MKTITYTGIVKYIVICFFTIISCSKEDIEKNTTAVQPEVIPPEITIELISTTYTSATIKSNIKEGSQKITSTGICYDKQTIPEYSHFNVKGKDTVVIRSLEINSKYYARAYAIADNKIYYSNHIEFYTKDISVTVKVYDVQYREATLKMAVDEDVYGISEKGFVYSTDSEYPSNNINTSKGDTAKLKLLEYEGTYYVKAYIKISDRVFYSKDTSFTTKTLDRVTDYDGNVYRIIEMPSTKGPRLWLLDNFKGTHYANGDPIPNVTDDEEWTKLESGAYCYYDNNKEHAKTYGALYNYWVAADPRGLIPGWHTPSDGEWLEMSEEVGGGKWMGPIIGGKLKQAGTSHWQAPNTGATNETGFTALPAGVRRHEDGKFAAIETYTIFVSSNSFGPGFWAKILYYNKSEFHEGMAVYKLAGSSIRLIKTN